MPGNVKEGKIWYEMTETTYMADVGIATVSLFINVLLKILHVVFISN